MKEYRVVCRDGEVFDVEAENVTAIRNRQSIVEGAKEHGGIAQIRRLGKDEGPAALVNLLRF